MFYYELKKIWVKPGTKIAMLVLAGILPDRLMDINQTLAFFYLYQVYRRLSAG